MPGLAPGSGSTYPGDAEARTLRRALNIAEQERQRVPCVGLDPDTLTPATCTACPAAVLTACGDYGRAAGAPGLWGGERRGAPRRPTV